MNRTSRTSQRFAVIYDRPRVWNPPGTVRNTASLHKNRETARGRDRPQIIVCHPVKRTFLWNGDVFFSVGTCAEHTKRVYIMLSGQWTERCPSNLLTEAFAGICRSTVSRFGKSVVPMIEIKRNLLLIVYLFVYIFIYFARYIL